MDEDAWHSINGERTSRVVHRVLARRGSGTVLNAGSGIYRLGVRDWEEIAVDLFLGPLAGRHNAICASIEQLPFQPEKFQAAACVGEVLAYCDPTRVLAELSRILQNAGVLIVDFRSSQSARFWRTETFGRAADLVSDEYNGSPESTWVYSPQYIAGLIRRFGLRVDEALGTHTWASVARRLGIPVRTAIRAGHALSWLPSANRYADVVTIVATRL